MSLHLDLAAYIDEHFQANLDAPVETKLDALIVRLDNGTVLEARIAAPDAYAIAWAWGEAELRIDTAPLHRQLATFPNHLHQADGSVVADQLTRVGADPSDNLSRVLEAILKDPLLDNLPGEPA